jgi:hypothetical protein
MKIRMSESQWLKIGNQTGWLRTADNTTSQLDAMLGQTTSPLQGNPQYAKLKQQYQGIMTEQQWVANFSQVLPQIAATIAMNIDSLNNMPSKDETSLTLLADLQRLQQQVDNTTQSLRRAQVAYAQNLQGMMTQVQQLTQSFQNTSSGVFPSPGGTSNIPLGGAPAIPAH